jgi:hypothetical protein
MSLKSTRRLLLRLFVSGLGGLAGIVMVGTLPVACQSGGIGDPCIPEDEYSTEFSGYDVAEEYIESRSFQCQSRICLVNHFQGRVSCPLGQPPPRSCGSPDDASCGEGQTCVESASISPACTPAGDASQCAGFGECDPATGFCACDAGDCPEGAHCDPESKRCKRYVCHTPGSCQSPSAGAQDNRGKSCCVPGTDTPVAVPVCGQCSAVSGRNAPAAVYCSCRCGPPDGAPPDDQARYCDCPSGFDCQEIRKDFHLGGDEQLAGKYCVKQGSAFDGASKCGEVQDYFDPRQCTGIAGTGL